MSPSNVTNISDATRSMYSGKEFVTNTLVAIRDNPEFGEVASGKFSRFALEKLVAEGYLSREVGEREGRGRKPIVYTLTPKGRQFVRGKRVVGPVNLDRMQRVTSEKVPEPVAPQPDLQEIRAALVKEILGELKESLLNGIREAVKTEFEEAFASVQEAPEPVQEAPKPRTGTPRKR